MEKTMKQMSIVIMILFLMTITAIFTFGNDADTLKKILQVILLLTTIVSLCGVFKIIKN